MAGIRLEFAQFGYFDSFDIIRSATSMAGLQDHELPAPIITGLTTMYYVDTEIVKGEIYYYKARVWRGSQSFVSEEMAGLAGILWSPSYLINPANLWLSAENTITDSSGRVSQITDKSGNNYHFTQSNNNFKPIKVNDVIRFNGVNNVLYSSPARTLFRNTYKYWTLSLCKVASGDGERVVLQCSIASGNGWRSGLRVSNGVFEVVGRVGDSNFYSHGSPVSQDLMISYREVDMQSGLIRISDNGSSISSKAIQTGLIPNTAPKNDLSVGGNEANASTYAFSGDLHFLIVGTGSTPTNEERQKLEGWAAHKYGFTTNLPANHPYKTQPPLTDD